MAQSIPLYDSAHSFMREIFAGNLSARAEILLQKPIRTYQESSGKTFDGTDGHASHRKNRMPFDFFTAVTGSFLSTLVLTLAMGYLSMRPGSQQPMRWWTAGSAALALRYLLILLENSLGKQLSLFLAEASHVVSALLILQGTVRLAGMRSMRVLLGIAVALAILWTFLGVYVFQHFLVLTVPLYLFAGIAFGITGYVMFRIYRREGGLGHALAAAGFLVWGVHKWDYPFLRLLPEMAPLGFLFSNFLQMVLSVALIVIAVNRQTRRIARQSTRMRYFSDHDLLTGLPNRRAFTAILDTTIHAEEAPVLLVFFDLRRFHEINEEFGQRIGDQVLRVIARRVQDLCQGPELIARVGGDEFAILIHSSPEEPTHETFLRRLDMEIGSPVTIGESEFRLDYAVGTAWFPRDGHTAEELMKNASASVLDARRTGVRFRDYGELRSAEALERMNLRRDLFHALKREEFHIAYQPQVDLSTGRICGAEALLRWRHPKKGDISPSVFIPLAESSEFILLIGEWVLEQTTQDMSEILKQGFDLRLSVNLSAVQFKHEELAGAIRRVLAHSTLPPDRLELEITESTVIHDERFVQKVMADLHSIGLQFAIDDFGTGYSSLSVLRRLPFDRLKIDRSFIKEIEHEAGARNIVEAIIWMGHGLNLRVLAEGVETPGQLRLLRELGCDEVQGFLTGGPVPRTALERALSDNSPQPIG